MERSTYAAAAAAVRGRRADDRAGRRPGRGRRLPDRARHGRGRRARGGAHRARAGRPRRASPACGSSARRPRRTAAARCRSWSTASTRTTSARCSTTRASRCGSGTTAPGRCTAGSASPATTRASFDLYNTTGRGRRAGRRRRSAGPARFFAAWRLMQLEQLYQEIILDHYRHPHHAGLREPFDAEVHHVNPTCGDEVTLRVRLTGTARDAAVVGRLLRRRWAARSPRPRRRC